MTTHQITVNSEGMGQHKGGKHLPVYDSKGNKVANWSGEAYHAWRFPNNFGGGYTYTEQMTGYVGEEECYRTLEPEPKGTPNQSTLSHSQQPKVEQQEEGETTYKLQAIEKLGQIFLIAGNERMHCSEEIFVRNNAVADYPVCFNIKIGEIVDPKDVYLDRFCEDQQWKTAYRLKQSPIQQQPLNSTKLLELSKNAWNGFIAEEKRNGRMVDEDYYGLFGTGFMQGYFEKLSLYNDVAPAVASDSTVQQPPAGSEVTAEQAMITFIEENKFRSDIWVDKYRKNGYEYATLKNAELQKEVERLKSVLAVISKFEGGDYDGIIALNMAKKALNQYG